jgi:hypothetical protein
MQPHASDRLTVTPDGTTLLACRRSKGWVARTPAGNLARERPGTAVCWDGEFYEVLEVEALTPSGTRYTLAPWEEHHAMRVADDYDEASEVRRAAEWRAAQSVERKRKSSNALAVFTGHLPATAQIRLHDELGVGLRLATTVSALPPLAFFVAEIFMMVRNLTDSVPIALPGWLFWLGIFMGIESIVRLLVSSASGKPMGTLLGLLLYSLWYFLAPDKRGMPPPLAVEKGFSTPPIADTPDELVLMDAFLLREPYLSFLSPPEQKQLAERFGFDPIRYGRRTAWMVMVIAAVGIVSSLGMWRSAHRSPYVLLSFATAAYLFVEQLIRLANLQQKQPCGSVIGYVIRPFCKVLLKE